VSTDVNVAVVGAGQAGLATSYHLSQAGIDHAVLEAGRVAETWRSRRWDSFTLVTPNWTVKLPGGEYRGDDPDGFLPREQIVDHFERWAGSFAAPLKEDCQVEALDREGDTFVLDTATGKLRARSVVVATGGYQRAYRPPGSDQVPSRLQQLLAEDYRNPTVLPEGAVLVIGGGQTGCQITDELHRSGRKVFLSCGRAPWAPRRMGGHDLVWWIIESGFWQRTLAQLPSPAGRLISNPLTTGHGGGRDLHYRTLHGMGVQLLGRFLGADDRKFHFAPDLAGTLKAGDDLARVFMKWVEGFCAKQQLAIPWEVPDPLDIEGAEELDIDAEGIKTVIWTTGYRPDYRWVHADVFDDMGFPIQTDGRSDVPGLYFMGVHFQRKAQSAVLYGVGEDAQLVAEHIVENRR
jgi:putative flavoprotein involved in K+ transport